MTNDECRFRSLIVCMKNGAKKSLGLQNGNRDDDEFNFKIRMLAAVAFVPTTDVIRAFESLSENFPLDAPT